MGSRGNIFVVQNIVEESVGDSTESRYVGVYLYSHWEGHSLARYLQYALQVADNSRWNDLSYLTAIIFRVMDMNQPCTAQTGRGISIRREDNQYNIIRVLCPDTATNLVQICAEGTETLVEGATKGEKNFPDFVRMSPEEIHRFHHLEREIPMDPIRLDKEMVKFLKGYSPK